MVKLNMLLCSFFLLFSLAQGQGITESSTEFFVVNKSGSQNADLINEGGPVISKPNIVILKFNVLGLTVGTGYCPTVNDTTDSENPSLQYDKSTGIDFWLSRILGSKCVDWFSEYGFTSGSLVEVKTLNISVDQLTLAQSKLLNVPVPVNDSQIQAALLNCFGSGTCHRPDNVNNKPSTIYLTYFQKGVQVTYITGGILNKTTKNSCVDFCAYHTSFFSSTYGQIVYAVFPDLENCPSSCGGYVSPAPPPSCSVLHQMVTFHELAECISDPIPNGQVAWNSPNGENADICEGQLGYCNDDITLPVQYIWSQQDEKCITNKDFNLTTYTPNIVVQKNITLDVSLIVTQKGGSTQNIALSVVSVIPASFTITFGNKLINTGNAHLYITDSNEGQQHDSNTPLLITVQGTGEKYSYSITYSLTKS